MPEVITHLPDSDSQMNLLQLLFSSFLMGLITTSGVLANVAEDSSLPNIILIMAEDIGNDLGCYGTDGVKTPTLDSLSKGGIRYTRFYTNSPICSPSRTAIMLGMYPTSCNGHNHRSSVTAKAGIHYLTHFLRRAGYVNLLGSKVLERKSRKTDINVRLEEPMFDKSRSEPSKPFFQQIQLQVTHRQANDSRWQDLRAAKADPVKTNEILIPPYLPDTPEVRLDWATYLDQIEQADKETNQIIKDLARRGQLENSIIIWMGDNGRCQIRGKGYLYEDGIRCPLLIWGKGIEKGKVIDDLVSGVDLTATILALAGIQLPDQMQGQAFLSNPNYHAKDYVYAARDRWDEISDCSRVVIGKRFKYIRNFMPTVPFDAGQKYLDTDNVRPLLPILRRMHEAGKLNDSQSYFFRAEKEPEQLYDLDSDPWELDNLANSSEHQVIKERLKVRLFDWIRSINDHGLEQLSDGTWRPILDQQKSQL